MLCHPRSNLLWYLVPSSLWKCVYRCEFSISFTVRFATTARVIRPARTRQYTVHRHCMRYRTTAHGACLRT